MTASDSPVRAAIRWLTWLRVMRASSRAGPVPPLPARTDPAAGRTGRGHGGAGRGVMFAMVKRKERPDAGRGEEVDGET